MVPVRWGIWGLWLANLSIIRYLLSPAVIYWLFDPVTWHSFLLFVEVDTYFLSLSPIPRLGQSLVFEFIQPTEWRYLKQGVDAYILVSETETRVITRY